MSAEAPAGSALRSVDLGRSTVTMLTGPEEAASATTSTARTCARVRRPAPHVHRTFAESFLLLDGRVELYGDPVR